MRPIAFAVVCLLAASVDTVACTQPSGDGTPPGPGATSDPGRPVATKPPPEEAADRDAIEKAIAECAKLDADGFAARFSVPWSGPPAYDPLGAANLSLVQASSLALDAEEKAALAARGFVLTDRKRFPSFAYGYDSIYAHDLPVYVSADSILDALHRSYDAILEAIERAALRKDLEAMLQGMRARLAEVGDALAGKLDLSADPSLALRMQGYFPKLRKVATTLGATAQAERTGAPLSPEQVAFVNQAVRVQMGCGEPLARRRSGWRAWQPRAREGVASRSARSRG